LIAEPLAGARELGRHVQVLRAQRFPLGGTCELVDWSTWLLAQCRMGHAAGAWWAHVQTTYPEGLYEQMAALEPGIAVPIPGEEQVLLLAYAALAAGARGLIFQSDAPLDGHDAPSQARAAALSLVNQRLELIEPMVAGARRACLAQAGQPEIVAPVLQNDRAWLVLPMWLDRGAQCVCGKAHATGVTIVVPGVPEAYQAYQVTWAGVLPLARERVAGGMRLTLEELDVAAAVLLTSDAGMVSAVHRRAASQARRVAGVQCRLATWRHERDEAVDRRLSAQGRRLRETASWLAEAQRVLASCAAQQRSGDWASACRGAAAAVRELRQVGPGAAAASAGMATFPGLVLLDAVGAMAGGQWGPNRLAAATASQEEEMRLAGWQTYRLALPGVVAEARLAVRAADGVYPIRLAVERAADGQAPELVETAPVWVESPAIPVRQGEWWRIRGRVWLEEPVTGSIDGLMIIDSLGGLGMAERIAAADGWREFVLYRVAPADGELYLTFALSGYGLAWLDALAVESFEPAESRPQVPALDALPLKANRHERPAAQRR
jgi:hypothetical protein